MSKILMVASEAAPFAKTGGLADVLGSLPAALHESGEEVAVLLPRYRGVAVEGARRVSDSLPTWPGGAGYATGVCPIAASVSYYLLECPELYEPERVYA